MSVIIMGEKSKYGSCPYCGYELNEKNSDATLDPQDSYTHNKAILIEYHFSASPNCKMAFLKDIIEKNPDHLFS